MTAVVLLSHGSPDPRSAAAAREAAKRLAHRGVRLVATAAFLQHDRPSLADACSLLADAGHRRVIVVPMLLSRAFHARMDVPREIARAQRSSGLEVVLARGLDSPDLLAPALDRGVPAGPVVLAAAATTDPQARDSLRRFSDRWAAQRGAPVEVAFVSLAAASVLDALRDMETRHGAAASVASLLLYPGLLHDHVVSQAGASGASAPLSDAPELTDLVLTRLSAHHHTHPERNCA